MSEEDPNLMWHGLNAAVNSGKLSTEGYNALKWLLGTNEGLDVLRAALRQVELALTPPPPQARNADFVQGDYVRDLKTDEIGVVLRTDHMGVFIHWGGIKGAAYRWAEQIEKTEVLVQVRDPAYGHELGGPQGDGVCCGESVLKVGPMVQWVAMMGDAAPHTTDRFCLTYKWQCRTKEAHHGYWRETSNDEKWSPTPVKET